jgi:UDP-3-O-[3-hydroxymyristoyl] N-acetylglucosamine deacetylase
MSACSGLGLDNVLVEIDGPEMPIMDGSAIEFVAAIEATGLVTLGAARRYLRFCSRSASSRAAPSPS